MTLKNKKTEGQTRPKSKGGSLAVGTYLQRGGAPPPPPNQTSSGGSNPPHLGLRPSTHQQPAPNIHTTPGVHSENQYFSHRPANLVFIDIHEVKCIQ